MDKLKLLYYCISQGKKINNFKFIITFFTSHNIPTPNLHHPSISSINTNSIIKTGQTLLNKLQYITLIESTQKAKIEQFLTTYASPFST